jgi:hypothetical protein
MGVRFQFRVTPVIITMTFSIDTDYLYKNSITAQEYTIAYLFASNKQALNAYVRRFPLTMESLNRLINAKLFINNNVPGGTDIKYIEPTEKFRKDFMGSNNFFEEFWDAYPTECIRADGSRATLKTNPVMMKKIYDNIVRHKPDLHAKIMSTLLDEINDRIGHGSLKWMKGIKNWIEDAKWEVQDNNKQQDIIGYGDSLTELG